MYVAIVIRSILMALFWCFQKLEVALNIANYNWNFLKNTYKIKQTIFFAFDRD